MYIFLTSVCRGFQTIKYILGQDNRIIGFCWEEGFTKLTLKNYMKGVKYSNIVIKNLSTFSEIQSKISSLNFDSPRLSIKKKLEQ